MWKLATTLLTTAFFTVLAVPSLAGPPADIAPAGGAATSKAQDSFAQFAHKWMREMHQAEARNRSHPKVTHEGGRKVIAYTGYDDGVRLQLKPTGSVAAPYVGLLQYQQKTFHCTDEAGKSCRVVSTTPVTEIFRFQNGRWVY
jgi:hypothetical protein